MLVSFFSSNNPLYIGKNPVEKLCKVLEMELKTYTPVGLKFVFEKIKFKVLHYIQHDFIRQRPGLSKDQISMFKSLVINYIFLYLNFCFYFHQKKLQHKCHKQTYKNFLYDKHKIKHLKVKIKAKRKEDNNDNKIKN